MLQLSETADRHQLWQILSCLASGDRGHHGGGVGETAGRSHGCEIGLNFSSTLQYKSESSAQMRARLIGLAAVIEIRSGG